MSQHLSTRGFSAVVDELRQRYGWKLNDELGRGGFAIVYREEVDGIRRAVKISLDSLQDDNPVVQRQLEALQLLVSIGNHPQLLTLIRYEIVLGHLVTVWELADQGTLADLLQVYQQLGLEGIPLEELLEYMKQAAAGIDFLNGRGIYHRDIKPQNLFLVGGQVKVGDLGLLKLAGATTVSHTGAGTHGFLPPEAYGTDQREGRLHPSIDVYGLAATYVYLRTGKPPFGTSPGEIYHRQTQERPVSEGLTSAEADWLCLALSPNPDVRPLSACAFVNELARRLSNTLPVVEAIPVVELPEVEAVRLPEVRRAYIPAADIPTLPRHLRQLQQRYLALEEAIRQVKQGTHPALLAVSQRLRSAAERAQLLRAQVEAAPLPDGVPARIRDIIWQRLLHNPDQPPSAFLNLLPGRALTWEFLHWLAQVKQAALASRPVVQAERAWQATKDRLIRQLRAQQQQLWQVLDATQRHDLTRIMRIYRRQHADKAEALPVELWAELGPKLQDRYLGWDAETLLLHAEQAWEEVARRKKNLSAWLVFGAFFACLGAGLGMLTSVSRADLGSGLGGAIMGGFSAVASVIFLYMLCQLPSGTEPSRHRPHGPPTCPRNRPPAPLRVIHELEDN